jgi:hypothetical protein
MTKLCIFVGTALGGIVGSLIAGALGLETFSLGGFFLGGAGSLVGVWAGWKVARKLE